MIAMYFVPYETGTLLIQSAVILPQIYSNMKHTRKGRFLAGYYLGYLSTRALLPFYIRGCPTNIFRLAPSFGICTLWASSYLFQLVILFLQARLGGRFFVPRCCLFYYQEDGYRLIGWENTLSNSDCCICLSEFGINEECSTQGDIVQSPCRHYFHLDCLKTWMEVKHQCPACRRSLPELNIP
jgi:hypothetical protein